MLRVSESISRTTYGRYSKFSMRVLHDTLQRLIVSPEASSCRYKSSVGAVMYNISTVGSGTFPVSGPLIWNDEVTLAQSMPAFRQRLKTRLIQLFYTLISHAL
jgi:hypothetical protein